ncbi:MAG: hypothetical protein V2A72_07190 [Candidatus Omnitrophota bacterium]
MRIKTSNLVRNVIMINHSKLIIFIITLAFLMQNAQQSYALRPVSFANLQRPVIKTAQDLHKMLDAYDKICVLSKYGKKISRNIEHNKVTFDDLGFDISEFIGLTYAQAVEKLVLPKEYGGVNDGSNCVFISPEEYVKKNPEFLALDSSGNCIFSIYLLRGCDNDCMFCNVGGKRPVKSLPYSIYTQVMLSKETIDLYYYNGAEDVLHYHDEISAANIVNVLNFEYKYRSVPYKRTIRTAGHSPFDKNAMQHREVIRQLRQLNSSWTKNKDILLLVTFHLYMPEIEEAILEMNKEGLILVVGEYMKMFKELFLCWDNVSIINRSTDFLSDLPETIKLIDQIQKKAIERLEQDEEIRIKDVLLASHPDSINWMSYANPDVTINRLIKAEKRGKLISFIENLDIDEIIRDSMSWISDGTKANEKFDLNQTDAAISECA